MLRRDFITLKIISEEISIALEFIADTPIEVFLSNEMIKHATGMTAINIGELVKNLSEDFRVEYNNIPVEANSRFSRYCGAQIRHS